MPGTSAGQGRRASLFALNLEEFVIKAEGKHHPKRRLESEILQQARREAMLAWSEEDLSRFLERALGLANQTKKKNRS
jgi:hypothetical protein